MLKRFIVLTFLFFYLDGKPLLKLTSPEGKETWLLGLMHYGDIEDTLTKSLEVIGKTKPIRYFAVEDFARNVLSPKFVTEMEQLFGKTVTKVPDDYKEKVQAVTNFWPEGEFWETETWKSHSLLYIHKLYVKHFEQHNAGSSKYVMSAETWIQHFLVKVNPAVGTYDLEPTTPDYRRMVIRDYEKLMDSKTSLENSLKSEFSQHKKEAIESRAQYYRLGWIQGWEPSKFFIKRNFFMAKNLVELVNVSNDEGIVLAAIGYNHLCGDNAVQEILERDYGYTVNQILF